ncbi:monooxygenase [Salinicoccus carnicancri]|uniref:monooxygenase n=1 Tax=Salinicoccus carnicancri TaxID=558170 RepID=UPI00031D6C80|nr:monooxygenase [Salinicoccus carnicancri]
MSVILQVDFSMEGPFGSEMASQFEELAESINEERGFQWKIWTEDADNKEAGGIYVFDTKENAQKYLDMHAKRLKSFGIDEVNAKIFDINRQLTKITDGPAV